MPRLTVFCFQQRYFTPPRRCCGVADEQWDAADVRSSGFDDEDQVNAQYIDWRAYLKVIAICLHMIGVCRQCCGGGPPIAGCRICHEGRGTNQE